MMASSINCCQINLQKSLAGSSVLNDRDEKIVFVTEPATKGSRIIYLNRPDTDVLAHSGNHRPRAALRVNRGLHPWLIPEYTDGDMCTVTVKIEGRQVIVCSLYLDINLDAQRPLFLALIDRCNSDQVPLIVGMDSNAHSTLWGCQEGNSRGGDLESLFLSKNLTVMNAGSVPTFVTSRAQSIIDVTVVNCAALEHLNLREWTVSTEMSASDHRYILFELGKYRASSEKFRNLRKADWDTFQSLLSKGTLPTPKEDGSNLDECAEALQGLIQEALDTACPLKPALQRPPNPWWNSELDDLRKELKHAHDRRSQSQEAWESYHELRKDYRKKISQAKRETWREFCTKAETAGDISKIVKILKPKQAKGISLFTNQGVTLTPKETLDNLMDAHFLESVETDGEEIVEAADVRYDDVKTKEFVSYITPEKVAASLSSFGPMKAAGPDGFKPLVLQKLTGELLEYINTLYRLAVSRGYAPKVWRTMRVVFIPKGGKTDYGNAKAYRPITLSNFLLKGLERLVQWYINDEILKEPLYAQHAYTKGRSCDTAISDAVDFIEKNTLRGQHVLAVSLDCSGAFDRIKFDSAKEAMLEHGIPFGILYLYLNILMCRFVRADLQGEKSTRIPKRGSPQGGVLSPLIWILIMNTILRQFKGTAIKVVGYADDILLLIAGPDKHTLATLMNEALAKVLNWGKGHGLIFNPTKTCAVFFTKSNRIGKLASLWMDGVKVKYDHSMKYLGVVLHRQLSWTEHCKERVSKAVKTINLANAAIGQKWGFSPDRALWVYTALARSVATYGAIVWSVNITQTIQNMLNKLQRKAMLSMTSSMRSTPTIGMEVVLGMLPLDLKTKNIGTNARWRTRDALADSWDGLGKYRRKGHRRLHDEVLETICPRGIPLDRDGGQRIWLTNEQIDDPDIMVYTDGSKMEDRTGAGWAACHGDYIIAEDSTYLGKQATVFQSEVVAIEQALRWITANCDKGTKVHIQSDSQSALQAIMNPVSDSKVVNACKSLLKQAKENQRIALSWIKGHADHTGNELADYLARKGSCMNCSTVSPEIPVPKAEVMQDIKDHYLAEWQTRWQQATTCRQTKIFFPRVNGKKIKKVAKLGRKTLNLLVQVGTGHALLARHTSRWTWLETTCRLCLEDDESIEHLFYECPAVEWQRREVNEIFSQDETEKKITRFFSDQVFQDLFQETSRLCGEKQSTQSWSQRHRGRP